MIDLPVKHKLSSKVIAYISISIAVILYGTSLTATKICLNEYSTLSLMAIRMSLSTILFIPFFLTIYRKVKIDKSDIKFILLMVLCEPCLYFIFETNALKFTSSRRFKFLRTCFNYLFCENDFKRKISKISLYWFRYSNIGFNFTKSCIRRY